MHDPVPGKKHPGKPKKGWVVMMRALIGMAAMVTMLAGTAGAQSIAVRSGEHEGFTRLVLTLPRSSEWRLSRTDDGYALSLAEKGMRFDLSDVFRLIPRSRLAAIWEDRQSGRCSLVLPAVAMRMRSSFVTGLWSLTCATALLRPAPGSRPAKPGARCFRGLS